MTPKDSFLKTLKFEAPEFVPHSNVIFELTEEAFGLSYPTEEELAAAKGKELEALIYRLVEIYNLIVDKYNWAAILVWRPWSGSLVGKVIKELKRTVGQKSLVGGFIANATWSLDSVTDYKQFAADLYDRPEFLKEKTRINTQRVINEGRALAEAGAEIIYLPNDWAHNGGLFFSRNHFEEFVIPALLEIIKEFKKLGTIQVLHSDGNIMSILDFIASSGADVLQSIDPLANMDITRVKRLTYGKIALWGNFNTVLLQDGTEDQIRSSARYCLENASAGGGYIFSASNTIFKGAKLNLYHEMLDVYHQFNRNNSN